MASGNPLWNWIQVGKWNLSENNLLEGTGKVHFNWWKLETQPTRHGACNHHKTSSTKTVVLKTCQNRTCSDVNKYQILFRNGHTWPKFARLLDHRSHKLRQGLPVPSGWAKTTTVWDFQHMDVMNSRKPSVQGTSKNQRWTPTSKSSKSIPIHQPKPTAFQHGWSASNALSPRLVETILLSSQHRLATVTSCSESQWNPNDRSTEKKSSKRMLVLLDKLQSEHAETYWNYISLSPFCWSPGPERPIDCDMWLLWAHLPKGPKITHSLPVVPHKAVAEVSNIGNL